MTNIAYPDYPLQEFDIVNFKFNWGSKDFPYEMPKFSDKETLETLPKLWRNTLQGLLEIKSIIEILKDKNMNNVIVQGQECSTSFANEYYRISLNTLEKSYENRINHITRLSTNELDIQESQSAKAVLVLQENFLYKDFKNPVSRNRDNFINAFFGTSAQVSNLDNLDGNIDSKKNLQETLHNQENLNYFGRLIVEQKTRPKSKTDFINNLKEHCRNAISKDELTILVKMYQLSKPPSLLNNQHKALIIQSLEIAKAYDKTNELDSEMKKTIDAIIDTKELSKQKQKQRTKNKSMELGL